MKSLYLRVYDLIVFTICLLLLHSSCADKKEEKYQKSNTSSYSRNQYRHSDNDNDSDNDTDVDYGDDESGEETGYTEDDLRAPASEYEDGSHTATVEYYNSNTGTRSTYTLDVDVEDGKVTRIHFPNGGYLDEHHYTSDNELDDDGEVSITSDENENVEYSVTIED